MSKDELLGELPSPLDRIVDALKTVGIDVSFDSYNINSGAEFDPCYRLAYQSKPATMRVTGRMTGKANGSFELNLSGVVWPEPKWHRFSDRTPPNCRDCHVKFANADTRLRVCDGVFRYDGPLGPRGSWRRGDVAVRVDDGDQWKIWRKGE